MVLETASLERRHSQLLGLLDSDDILRQTTRLLTDEYGFDLSWIAEPTDGGALISHVSGNRTDAFQGIVLLNGLGLGGKVYASGNVTWVDDYLLSSEITHDYDEPVASEALHRMIGAPIIAGDRNFGVLLGGHRNDGSWGTRSADLVRDVAQRCAEALFLAERVRAATEAAVHEDRRRTVLAIHDTVEATLTSIAAKLREAGPISHNDDAIRQRLRAIECQAEEATAGLRKTIHGLLAAPVVLWPDGAERSVDASQNAAASSENRSCRGVTIAKREYDVLCRVAIGETNSEIAAAMNLSCNTIKTYLRNVMSKLGARNRVEAIVHAKEMGLL
jgi:DNA-binding NarL/FixJ family response regulator